jgi:hypothetical protein
MIILSDLVVIEQGTGKPSMIGSFDRFTVPQVPFRIGRFFATVGVTNLRGPFTELNITVRVEVPDSGHVVLSASQKIEFQGPQPGIFPSTTVNFAIPIIGATFPQAGLYAVVALLNNDEIGRRYVEVSVITSSASPS